jgi:hypothetical protein
VNYHLFWLIISTFKGVGSGSRIRIRSKFPDPAKRSGSDRIRIPSTECYCLYKSWVLRMSGFSFWFSKYQYLNQFSVVVQHWDSSWYRGWAGPDWVCAALSAGQDIRSGQYRGKFIPFAAQRISRYSAAWLVQTLHRIYLLLGHRFNTNTGMSLDLHWAL